MTKRIRLFFAALAMTLCLGSNAMAAQWITGNILQVGYFNDFPYILINSADNPVAFTGNLYFMLNQSASSYLLATALTAESLNKPVSMYVNSLDNWAVCTAVAVTN